MTTLPVPPDARYAIILWADQRVAFFSSIEKVVRCMRELEIALDCEVTRVQGDVMVWPIHMKGGQA